MKLETIKKNIFSVKVNQIVFIVFLTTLFVYGFMNRLIDSRDVFIIGAPICIYWMLQRKISPFDLQFLFLFGTFYLMAIFEFMTEPWMSYRYNVSVYAYIFPFTYLLGKMCIGESKFEYEKRTFIVLSTIAAGMFSQAFLDYMKKNVTNPANDIRNAGFYAFWNDEYILKNEVEFYFYMIIAALFFAFLTRNKNKKLWVSTVLALIFIVVNSLIVRGRSAILLTVALFGLLSIIFLFTNDIKPELRKIVINIAVIGVAIAVILVLVVFLNIGGIGNLYKNSFLARDGGILHNVRFTWEREGYRKIFTLQKGGWNVDSNVLQGKLHNSWMEYGRNYDIIIYLMLMLFAVSALIRGIVALIKYNNKCLLLFWAVGAQILFFLYFSVERMGFADRDWIILYVFLSGLVAGLTEMQTTGEYAKLNYEVERSKHFYSDFGLIFLFMSYLGMAYMDWWNDTDSLLISKVVLPVVIYIIPFIVNNALVNKIIILISGVISAIVALLTYKNNETQSLIFAYLIIMISIILGVIGNKLRINKILTAVLSFLGFLGVFFTSIVDGRLDVIKEALHLSISYEFGSPWGNVGLNTSEFNSSSNVWLNYSRDYGRIIWILLSVFAIWMIVQLFRLVINRRNKEWIDYALIIAFILYNGFFMISDVGYDSINVFYGNLLICGNINYRLADKCCKLK